MKTNYIFLLLLIVCFSKKAFAQETAPASVTDIDGNSYRVLTIGKLLVMDENLRVTRYQNGDALLHAPNKNDWISSRGAKGAYAFYEDNSSWTKRIGGVYNYVVVADSRNICPVGWRIPNNEEWKIIAETIRSIRSTNSNFFTTPPNIFRFFGGDYEWRGNNDGALWSSTAGDDPAKFGGFAWSVDFKNLREPIQGRPVSNGLCIRCIRDMPKREELAAMQQTVTDKSGNVYRTVQLGKQTWMAEDLRTTMLNDGTPINSNKTYNFSTVNTGKLCPSGWKVPSVEEWNELIGFYGGETAAGAYLIPSKQQGTENPFSPSSLNEQYGKKTYWTATLCGNKISAEAKVLNSFESSVKRDCIFLDNYLPVRCIKGESPMITEKPKTIEEWKNENKSVTYTPGSKDDFPVNWPAFLKSPAKNIVGSYTTNGCSCEIKETAQNEVYITCFASSWTGKMKDLGRGVDKEYKGSHTAGVIEFRNLIKPFYYIIDMDKGVKIYYYPDSKKYELLIDKYRLTKK